jgi:hypothetical protein
MGQVNPSGQWRTLHTDHFRIHFRPSYRNVAVEAAGEAERAYRLLSTELHAPRGVIDLTLSDDIDTPNGFTTTYPSNRFTILLTPPVTDPALQTYDSWLRLVIVHELTHVFHLDRSRGVWAALQSLFGRAPGLFPNQYQPSWVIEGLATYYESRFTAGGRAEGSFHRQAVGADASTGQPRSPWDALLFTRWPDGLAPYAYGSRFWEYLSQNGSSGDSVIPRFIEKTSGQLIPFRVGHPLRRTGPTLEKEWRNAVTTAVPSQHASESQVIASALRSQPVPRLSPNGRFVAYVYDDGHGARRVRVADVQTWGVLRSHRVNGQVSYDWLGDTLVVAQLDFVSRWNLRSDLWRWLPNGSWQRITDRGRLMEPRGGGGVLAALQIAPAIDAPAFAPQWTRHAAESPGATWGPAVPAPDGRAIVAPRHQNGHWALVRWNTDAPQSIEVLFESPSEVADPVWTRDGGVLFVTDAREFPQIHLWKQGQGVTQMTAEPLGARTPAVLADGRILFTTLGHEGWELRAVAPLATSRPLTALSLPPPFDSAPHVSMRETGYTSWPSLRPYFWIPLGFNAAEAGRFAGAATAGTDAVGRYTYVAEGLVSAAPLRLWGSFLLLDAAPGNPTLDFSASSDWSLVGIDSTRHVVSEEHRDAAAGATFVASGWRNFFSVRVAAEYEGRRFVSIPDTSLAAICDGCSGRDLVGGSASLAFGSVVSAPLAVSLQDGFTVGFLFRRREEQGSARWSDQYRGRAGLYARLGPRVGFAYPVLAVRLAAGAIDGSLPDHLSIGGVSSGSAQIGFGQSVGALRTFPVRGYDGGAARGHRAATISVEYRVPLALPGKALGHLPIGTDKVSFSLFGDMGDAWEPGQGARLYRLRSVGAELVTNMTVSYDLPLALRFGVAQPAAGHTRLYAAFGSDF